MKKRYETHVEDTDKLISVAGPILEYKSWYEQYRKLMEEQAQRKYGLYTPTSEGDDDDFPSIPGMIARYSALGLTNEQMATNPVWADKTGNDHDLQMKNFAWKGMSGVGGYTENYDSNRWHKVTSRIDTTWTYKSFNVKSIKDNNAAQLFYQSLLRDTGFRVLSCTIKVSGLTDGQGIEYVSNGTQQFVIMRIENDGIYHLPSFDFGAKNAYYGFKFLKLQESCNITIEQLPLYPGFILGDGVDDFAITEKELNFEDTYTVYTAFIPFQNNPTRNMILCGADSKKTFSMQYSSLVYVSFIAGNNYYINADFVNGLNLFACKRNGNNICIKNLLTNKVVTGTCGDWVENAGLYYLWKNATYASFAKAAIAGQTICNGYFSTDEDDEKVLDWYKKQYPWLFPDQAWTVVGKTNEDEDRATIANITGNGNNLVLSNFGFAEGSGYGLYGENYNGGRWVKSTDKADITWTSYSVNVTSVKIASTQLYYQSYPEQPSFTVPSYKIKVYGLKDGQTLSYKQATSEGQQIYKISEDGIYTLPSFPFKANGDWYGFTLNKVQETCDITIEQIPEYEGYLVTDGVDDKITSSIFEMGNDWTVIGDWELINTGKKDNAGIVKFDSIVIYNYNPILINIKNGRNNLIPDQNTVNAICSDGRIYSKDWKESIYNEETESTSKNFLTIGYSGNSYTKIAFKNLAIYPTVLSKEDCIKAYNYLQTLKAK
nr:MAG: hypothetical protein [Bacteriophage sp.]